eukprot:gene13453-13579_t
MSTHPGDERPKKRKNVKQKVLFEQVPHAQAKQQQQHPATVESGSQNVDGNSKFARALGSTDYHTREQGLQALSRWLLHKQSMSELDMMRLWKGLFFCYWHSDKVPVQTELAERLAGLLPQLQAPMAALYWGGLLATLRREWSALDHHRLDKFLMLVRKFVAAVLRRLETLKWDASAVVELTSGLPLCQSVVPATDSRSLGLSYHLADVWLPELKGLNVYFAHGAPVPAPDIRTPPRAKPKGSALKSSSSRLGAAGNASAPAKQAISRLPTFDSAAGWPGTGPSGARRAVTPNSVPRVRAATFF